MAFLFKSYRDSDKTQTWASSEWVVVQYSFCYIKFFSNVISFGTVQEIWTEEGRLSLRPTKVYNSTWLFQSFCKMGDIKRMPHCHICKLDCETDGWWNPVAVPCLCFFTQNSTRASSNPKLITCKLFSPPLRGFGEKQELLSSRSVFLDLLWKCRMGFQHWCINTYSDSGQTFKSHQMFMQLPARGVAVCLGMVSEMLVSPLEYMYVPSAVLWACIN